MQRPFALAALAAAVTVVAGCGGGSSSSSPSSSASGSAPAAGAALATADHGLGPMLVDAQGRTLYLWKADAGTTSACTGACAQGWPPATVGAAPRAGTGVIAGRVGTTTRSDGSRQLTYAGHPLYRYAGDVRPGDVNGQDSNGFGAPWYVVAPDGKAITRAATSAPAPSRSGY